MTDAQSPHSTDVLPPPRCELLGLVSGGGHLSGRKLGRAAGGRRSIALVLPEELRAREGDVVLADGANGAGAGGPREVREVLARAGSIRAALYEVAARFGLRPDHSAEVHAEAAAQVEDPGTDDPALEDLTGLAFVTIDNDDSRDLDQALHIARGDGEDGSAYVVYYALADASYYVRPGSALFAEALFRGSSYYLPGFSLPMLPRCLSEGVISLNEGVDRRALVFAMTLDREGEVRDTRISRARVRSRAKLAYDGVQAYYDNPDPTTSPLAGHPWTETLDLLAEVGRLRIAEARRRDVISYDRAEVEVHFEDEGTSFTVVGDHRNDCERYNEQISLLCNTEGARWLGEAGDPDYLQPVFRVHSAPPPERLTELALLIDELVEARGLPRETWTWHRDGGRGESLADYLMRLRESGGPERVRRAVDRQAVVTNQRSIFSAEPGYHYGLGAARYARFSAPMREIVGIFTHKEAVELLDGGVGAAPNARDEALREQVVEAGNRSKETQRSLTKEANRVVLDQLFGREMGRPERDRPWRKGTVMGLRATRIYVQLDEPPIEVKAYLRDLEGLLGTGFSVSEAGAVLRPDDPKRGPTICLGDPIELRVVEREKRGGRWVFRLR